LGAPRARPVVLDAGALIAFERNDPRLRTLVELALRHGGILYVAAGVVAQVWRDGRRQARLARLLGSGLVVVEPLDRPEAQAAGVLCARSRTSDVIDASVALLARRHRAKVVTSDPADLRRLDPTLELVAC
jgi:predicted nucleic acid-binding protein